MYSQDVIFINFLLALLCGKSPGSFTIRSYLQSTQNWGGLMESRGCATPTIELVHNGSSLIWYSLDQLNGGSGKLPTFLLVNWIWSAWVFCKCILSFDADSVLQTEPVLPPRADKKVCGRPERPPSLPYWASISSQKGWAGNFGK